jgi:hypothetical protein
MLLFSFSAAATHTIRWAVLLFRYQGLRDREEEEEEEEEGPPVARPPSAPAAPGVTGSTGGCRQRGLWETTEQVSSLEEEDQRYPH